ncbi:GntR family transcriptional regulator YhfZ [Streptomyces sp. NPDC015125]|uniref:GntR family transcriptional regulator YhfZ n=1 Tax=Streptomyces sp. NPDC015125 TaxID=3364938 RepID=UPI0037012CBE
MNGIHGPGGLDERFLTRNGHAARQLAALLLRQGADGAGARLPRVRDVAERLGVGNGTVQAALRLLEEAGAITTVARGHLGTFLVGSDRAVLWRLSGLGTVPAAMPLPHSRRFEGLATGLRTAFEEAGAPFSITFLRGAAARVAAVAEGRAELAVLSRFAADRLIGQQPVELIADLGPGSYAGEHGLLLRPGGTLGSPGLRVVVDDASEDQRMLTDRLFAHRPDVERVPCRPSLQPWEELARGRADAAVWNLDEVPAQTATGMQVLPLGDELTRDLAVRHASAALIGRTGEAAGGVLAAVRGVVELSTVTAVQGEVLRGERVPAY